LLGAIEAVDGLIIFGLTTAFIFTAIQDLRSHNRPRPDRAEESA